MWAFLTKLFSSTVKDIAGAAKDAVSVAKDATGIEKDKLDIELSQRKLERDKSSIQLATLDDIKEFDPKYKQIKERRKGLEVSYVPSILRNTVNIILVFLVIAFAGVAGLHHWGQYAYRPKYRVIKREAQALNPSRQVISFVLEHDDQQKLFLCSSEEVQQTDPKATCNLYERHGYRCEWVKIYSGGIGTTYLKCEDAENRNVYLSLP